MDLAQAIVQTRRRQSLAAWEPAVAQGPAVSGWVPVNCSGNIEQALCPAYVSPNPGDVLILARAAAPVVIGILKLGDPTAPDLGPPTSDLAPTSGVSYFPALFAFTWEQTSPETVGRFRWMNELCQGTAWPAPLPIRRAWWFYQRTVPAALAGVTVDAIRLRMPGVTSGPAVSVTLAFRSSWSVWPPTAGAFGQWGNVPAEPGTRDDDLASITATAAGGAAWVDLPVNVGQRMADASMQPGPDMQPITVGIVGAANVTLQGLDTDPMSGLLEITWHR